MDPTTVMPFDEVSAHDGASVMTVAVIDGRFAGALAYALQSALSRPARVRIVQLSDDDAAGQAPLPVDLLTGEAGEALVAVSGHSDVLVVQSPEDPIERLTDDRLVRLRRETRCLLLEVDGDGDVLRASGPLTWVVSQPRSVQPASEGVPLIVAGVDGSPTGGAAVEWARDMAVRVGATLRLVAVQEPGASADGARRALGEAGAAAGATTETVLVEGEPVDVLVRESAGAAMLVVGRHRTSGMLHSVMGGIGDSCARLATCPVVIVPSEVTTSVFQTGTDQTTRVPPPAA